MTVSDLSVALDPATVRRTTLPNGLRVLVRRDASAPVVAIVTYVSAGYFDETDDVVGIAHVLEHMYFKGTPTRGVGEIARQTKAVGGYLNAATIYDHTSYYTVLPVVELRGGLDVQFDAYANSLIDAEELARELEVIIQEAKRKADNPGAVATETLFELLHDRHRIRRWRIGREPGLRALTRDAMLRFYRNFYHPGNTVLVVVGDVDPDEAMREIAERYGALPAGDAGAHPGPAEEGTVGFRYRELAGDIGQTQLAIGWRTPRTLDDATARCSTCWRRCSAPVAHRGSIARCASGKLASSVSAYDYTPTELGVFVIHAETRRTARRTRRARSGPRCATSARTASGRPSSRARSACTRRAGCAGSRTWRGRRTTSPSGRRSATGRSATTTCERALAVTTDDMPALARRFLDPDQAGVIVYRPEGRRRGGGRCGAMRALLDGAPAARRADRASPLVVPAPSTGAARRARGGRRARLPHGGGDPGARAAEGGRAMSTPGCTCWAAAATSRRARAGLTSLLVRARSRAPTRRSRAADRRGGGAARRHGHGSGGVESFGWMINGAGAPRAAGDRAAGGRRAARDDPDDAVETERAIALADLVALRDDMYRYPVRLATQAAFAGHPYGVPATGDEAIARRRSTAAMLRVASACGCSRRRR